LYHSLVAHRLSAYEEEIAALERKAEGHEQRAAAKVGRVIRLADLIEAADAQVEALAVTPASSRQAGPHSQLNRLKKRIVGWRGQMERAQAQITEARAVANRHRERRQAVLAERLRLRERYERLSGSIGNVPRGVPCNSLLVSSRHTPGCLAS
jgi:chromosome segregation ATPase